MTFSVPVPTQIPDVIDQNWIFVGSRKLPGHRAHLMNLEFVTSMEPYDAARLQVVMRSGDRIIATREGSKKLRDLAI